MKLTTERINTYKDILCDIQKYIYAYFNEYIKCDGNYQIVDWEITDDYEFTITYTCVDSETGETCNDYFTITHDELNSAIEEYDVRDLIIDVVEFEECNPKAQPCVLTNQGIVMDIIKFD